MNNINDRTNFNSERVLIKLFAPLRSGFVGTSSPLWFPNFVGHHIYIQDYQVMGRAAKLRTVIKQFLALIAGVGIALTAIVCTVRFQEITNQGAIGNKVAFVFVIFLLYYGAIILLLSGRKIGWLIKNL